jgi:hypothetical protein
MSFKSLVGLIAAASLAASPAAAQPAPAAAEPAPEHVQGSALRSDAAVYVLPLLVLLAILLALVKEKEEPASP